MEKRDHILYQLALFQSVALGEYYGFRTVAQFKEHGDIGMGIFEAVNGELILLDGIVYQALADGSVIVPSDDVLIPYGNAAFFEADAKISHVTAAGFPELEKLLNEQVVRTGPNQFFFVKITGHFPYVAVRSELKQEEPFRMLNIALRTDQRKYEYYNIDGTIVGLYCPPYMQSMNAPGWHFHFISGDRTKGGHMTAGSLSDCSLQVNRISRFTVEIPDSDSFNKKDLGQDVMAAIREAEQGDF
ncbi:MAG: acetolactate decarboxylase [Parasporobacterium sp.]|nr:acetolactate decarboxylase [Parasporobacterium sp.]